MLKPTTEAIANAEAVVTVLTANFKGITPHRDALLVGCEKQARVLGCYRDIAYIKRFAESKIVHYIETGRRPAHLRN
jgi:hypothetical protein